MSWTPSVDVVGATYWSYMSAVMKDALDRTVRERRVKADAVPPGVLQDANEFFRLATGATSAHRPTNPPASIHAFVLAADVLRRESGPRLPNEKLEGSLDEYSEFVKRFRNARKLTNAEVALARRVSRFFEALHLAGEESAYEDKVQMETPSADLRVR